MPIDPHRDYTRQEQLALDLTELFAEGLRDEEGRLPLTLQGIGSAAMAMHVEEAGVPLPMFNRMLTTANEISLERAGAMPGELVEELEKRGFPQIARIVRAGIAACRDEDDYRNFVRWLIQVRNLIVFRAQALRHRTSDQP
ncbi:MAG: hypothetical protein C0183_13675 [Roseiflexus castenholzii]|uniref:hypothetical protein n=1 Tax=Roseiflexus castenholzii TaxID=120962 RepID=UPI000CABC006|nr:MAG: hypothetical protein C0183_13675 [Roseiflexus castenholzii]